MSFVKRIGLTLLSACAVFGQSGDDRIGSMPTFRSEAREVTVVFRAVDKEGRRVPGITANEIRIDDEGVQRQITSFIGDAAYAQVVVVADVSGSMATVLEPLQGALLNFADGVSGNSDTEAGDVLLSLLPFSDTARMLVDRTPDPREFKKAVSRLRPSGATALVDAILSTLQNAFADKDVSIKRAAVPAHKDDDTSPIPSEFRPKRALTASGLKRSKFLVIFTDAGENSSSHQWSEVASYLVGQGVVIYSVIFDSGTPDSNVSKLAGITKESGGKVYRAKSSDLKEVYEQIAKDIRGRYALMFSASDVKNTRVWRNIHVSTSRPGIVILARSGYCPESPCQKADGTFMGGQPKNWNDVMAWNHDPALISSIRERLRGLRFEYSPETANIVSNLGQNAILVERRRGNSGKDNKAVLVAHTVTKGSQSVSMDSEVCGISVEPENSRSSAMLGNSDQTDYVSGKSVLRVVDPEIRLSRKPGSGAQSPASDDSYFQSQTLFSLADPSRGIPNRLRVQCNRPHFLVGDGLVELAIQALEQALKITPERSIAASVKSSQ
jgi:VWFA-related protein